MSDFSLNNDYLRLDSEFSLKDHLAVIGALKASGAEVFGASKPTIIHPHEIVREYVDEGGVWFFRAQNVRPMAISEADKVFISQEDAAMLTRNELKAGDVVITRTGANAGDCALFSSDEPAMASSHTFIVRSDVWSHPYLVAFLNTRHGQAQIMKGRYGAAQPEVAPYYLRTLLIPRFSAKFEDLVARLFERSRQEKQRSTAKLAAAEQTLLQALGLDAWRPPEPLTYVRRASEALKAVRLDAEHFKPKFDDLIGHLMAGGDAVRLDQVLSFCERGCQPAYADEGVIVVNSRHVRTDAVILDGENRFATVEDETLLIRHGDILLNGTGVGTIGRVTTYLHDAPALPDNHVTILRLHPESDFDPVFLAVQLAGVVGQTQVEQHTRGSSGQLELYPQDIRRILVWRAPKEMQLAVRKNIEAGHAARREAQTLLARAQRAVEVAIEQGEPAALKLLAQ